MIVALTHARVPNDELIAKELQDVVDLVLGGHDHFYHTASFGDCQLVKSGSDFREFSVITCKRKGDRWESHVEKVEVFKSVIFFFPLHFSNPLLSLLLFHFLM